MIAVGDKVICVDNDWTDKSCKFVALEGHIPIINNVYVVEELKIINECLAFHLIGIRVIDNRDNMTIIWKSSHFRKLDEVKMENELIHYKSEVFGSMFQ